MGLLSVSSIVCIVCVRSDTAPAACILCVVVDSKPLSVMTGRLNLTESACLLTLVVDATIHSNKTTIRGVCLCPVLRRDCEPAVVGAGQHRGRHCVLRYARVARRLENKG